MKKLILSVFFSLVFIPVHAAVTANDIPEIKRVSELLVADAVDLLSLANQLVILSQNNFVVPVAGGVESVTLTNQQKLNLVAEYTNRKNKLITTLNQLP